MNEQAEREIRWAVVAFRRTLEQVDPEGSFGDPISLSLRFVEEIGVRIGIDPWERFSLALDLVADVFLAG